MQDYLTRYYHPIFFCLMIVLIGLSYYAGVLQGKGSGDEHIVLSCDPHTLSALTIPVSPLSESGSAANSSRVAASANGSLTDAPLYPSTTGGKYVGSKNGTKYYAPNCATVKRIKPANYIWFQSPQDAQLQGYTQGKC